MTLFISELFRQKFIIEGYKPIIAATAISAILALKEEKPTAIILDIVLPDSECWMILEYLRKRPDKLMRPLFFSPIGTIRNIRKRQKN